MKSHVRSLLIWSAILLGVLMFLGRPSTEGPGPKVQAISCSQFMNYVDQGLVESVTEKGESEFTGFLRQSTDGVKDFSAKCSPRFEDPYVVLRKKGITPNFEEEAKAGFWQSALLGWIPVLAIVLVFFLFMRQLQSGSNRAMSFGQSRAKMFAENQSKVKFADVAGCEEAKDELVEIVDFLKNPKKFTRLGGRIPKGVLLVGPPGTGKTLLAKAIAGEASVPFYSISGSEFVEMFVGVGASRVRSLFENAKRSAPCLIFIDEIDAVGRHRGAGLGGGHDEREQTLNQLLVEMDGFEGTEGIIMIAATNRVDVLDPALLRPGRFDRRVQVSKPDLSGRVAILKVHTRKVPIGTDVDLEIVARGTPGFAGADLENLVNEAALNAARNNRDVVAAMDFDYAKDKVSMGTPRRSMVMSEEEKRNTAFHESGHAVVGKLIPGNDPVHKVTIIPRGPALGVTMTLPTEDRYTLTRERAEAMIAFLMGGRVAEDIVFGHKTTGASNDIERATDLARRMVTEWGMSEKLGPVNLGSRNENIFLGREMAAGNSLSEETSRTIDAEIRGILDSCEARARKVLIENRGILDAMAAALLDRETIDKADLDALFEGRPLPAQKPVDPPRSVAQGAAAPADAKVGDVVPVIDLSKGVKA